MTSRERVIESLQHHKIDRVAIYDVIDKDTLDAWGLKEKDSVENYFDYDIAEFDFNHRFFEKTDLENFLDKMPAIKPTKNILEKAYQKNSFSSHYKIFKEKNKFLCLSLPDPFEYLVCNIGLEATLLLIGHSNSKAVKAFGIINEFFSKMFEVVVDGFKIDALWLWSDLCFNKGPYFSVSTYKNILENFHKELIDFCHKKNIFVFFHTDGNVKDILTRLVDLGIHALHPVEASCNDINFLKKEFGKDITFFGNIAVDILREGKDTIEKEVRSRLDIFKDSRNYIYCLDSPVLKDIDLDKYKFLLEVVRDYGK